MKKKKIIYSKKKLDNVIIPFGKHKDQPLDRVPLSYLEWLVNTDWLEGSNPALYKAVCKYLNDPVIKREQESEEYEREADELLGHADSEIPF